MALKGLVCRLTCTRAQHRSSALKAPGLYVKETISLILKQWPKEQGPAGIALQGWRLVDTIFLLPLCRFMFGDPVFMFATQRTPLDHLALAVRGACVPGSHGTVTIGETVLGRLPLSGHHTDSWLKHIPSLSENVAYLFVQEFWP